MNDLQKLFVNEMCDIYDAEHQLIDVLPKMAEEAQSDELRQAFQEHLEQTRHHARRLEEIFRIIGESPRRRSCKGIDEGEICATEFKDNSALDPALICAAQKVEHYEITSYACLCTWARELGNSSALSLLKQTLGEEKEADEKLSELAEGRLNIEAMNRDTAKKGEKAAEFAKMVTAGP
jgi:ferritin-like metal-binding protein YciE